MPRKPIDFIIISNTMLVKNLLVLMFLLCSKQASATFRTSCLNPSCPLNGRVTMTRSLFGYQKAIYSCKTGYKLVGMQTRSCFNGIWSGYRPICQLLNEAYRRVYYSCSPGFILAGKTGIDNKTLEKIKPYECYTSHLICKPIQCESLPPLINGTVLLSFGTNFQSRATFSCNAALTLIGDTHRECQADGKWSGTQPTCGVIKECSKLQPPHHGKIYVTGYRHGDYVITKCYRGYRLIGKTRLDCLNNGKWSGRVGKCVKYNIYWKRYYYY